MQKSICYKIEEFINLNYGGLFHTILYDKKNPKEGYLWVFKEDTEKMIMVIHGSGTYYNPFEIRLVQVDDNKTVDKQFDNIDKLMDYLGNDLLDDLMMYEI
jgi:hypothetical protein